MEKECDYCKHDFSNGGNCKEYICEESLKCIKNDYELFEPIEEVNDGINCNNCKYDSNNGGDCMDVLDDRAKRCVAEELSLFEPIDKVDDIKVNIEVDGEKISSGLSTIKSITIFYNKTINKYVVIKEDINYEILPSDIVLCEGTIYSSDIEKLLK